jgi:hypothetical protein
MKTQVNEAAGALNQTHAIVDITENLDYASKFRVFSPMMTVLKDGTRITAPLPTHELIRFSKQKPEPVKTMKKTQKPQGKAAKIVLLTADTLPDTCILCNYSTPEAVSLKTGWLDDISKKMSFEAIGLVSRDGERPVAAIEAVPSTMVPYPIPRKDKSTAFISCVYSHEKSDFDYRGQLIERICEIMRTRGFKRVSVVSGRRTAYPNGPASLFIEYGFSETFELDSVFLRDRVEELILMEKKF